MAIASAFPWIVLAFGGAACLALPAQPDRAEPAPFTSREGRFSVRFPEPPQEVKLKVHQFIVSREDGAFTGSYQDRPDLGKADRAAADKALVEVQARVEGGYQGKLRGKLLAAKKIALEKKYPGREYDLEFELLGSTRGLRCRTYLVNGRLYQLTVVGPKGFATSAEAARFLDSFKLAE
jgi:hypothetical protein